MDKDTGKIVVGLCIVFKNHNYGSILQSYGTLMKLDELGVPYEILNYQHPKSLSFYVNALSRLGSIDTIYSKIRLAKKKLGRYLHPKYAKNESIRGARFEEFVRSNFKNITAPIRSFSDLQEYASRFTDVLVGSDQLWLPSGLGTGFYNLMFVPEETNKIAYAASFGVASIPPYQKNQTREYLERIQHISLREEAGQKIVRELTGRNAPVILDPTMVVTKEQWDSRIENKAVVEGPYIFCYFLGNNPEHREEVNKLAREKKLKIVVLRHLDEYIPEDEGFGDIAPYDVGPGEFVNLIRHAEYVCTDSFHGSVFSVIYHKQFLSFRRYAGGKNSRNSRIETLFSNTGIFRLFEKDITEEIDRPVDWDHVDRKLEELRVKSNRFLHEALFHESEASTITAGQDHMER